MFQMEWIAVFLYDHYVFMQMLIATIKMLPFPFLCVFFFFFFIHSKILLRFLRTKISSNFYVPRTSPRSQENISLIDKCVDEYIDKSFNSN